MSLIRSVSRHSAVTADTLLGVVFPPRCSLCYAWTGRGGGRLCRRCSSDLEADLAIAACPRCAATVAAYEVWDGRCGKCRPRRPWTRQVIRAGPYVGALGNLLRNYKYGGQDDLGRLLIDRFAGAAAKAPWLGRIEVVVSVPTHWRHRVGRLLNVRPQPRYIAAELAAGIARRFRLPHAALLRRLRGGPHQVGLNYEQRARNVRGAFAMRRGVSLTDSRVLLVDDVKTTGATLNECAKVLRRGGAAEVYGAVVATAGWDRPADPPVGAV